MNTQPSPHHFPGALIAIEGIDGTGKSTLARNLVEHLSEDHSVLASAEPTHSEYGKAVRAAINARVPRLSPADELRMFVTDRKGHLKDVIEPALREGMVVILDRYYLSNVVYQGASGISTDEIFEANGFAIEPDLTLILDIPAEDAMQRITSRGTAATFETLGNLRHCRESFLELQTKQPSTVLDARQSPAELLADAMFMLTLMGVIKEVCHEF